MSNVAVKAERSTKSAHEVVESADFKALVAKRWKVSMALLVLLFVSYYGFVILVATAKDFVNQKVGEVTTLADAPLESAIAQFAYSRQFSWSTFR